MQFAMGPAVCSQALGNEKQKKRMEETNDITKKKQVLKRKENARQLSL